MVKKFRSSSARAESGFTLIEVMIAMTILSIGLMSIAVAQLTAIKVSSRSKHMQDAMFLARERMDTLAAIVPPEDPLIPSYFSTPQTTDDPAPIQVGNDENDATRYSRRIQIIPDQPQVGLARVIVTVNWNNANTNTGSSQIQLTSVMRIHN
jgi:type IV pilus assembly protein PilV